MPIAKVTQGSGAYDCLKYVLTKEKAELLQTNCAAETPGGLANEFDVAFQPHLRNGAKRHTVNHIAHFSIAFQAPLERQTLKAIAQRFSELMGFDPVLNQYVLAQHHDTDDCHLHLIQNRIRLDGTVVSDSFQGLRARTAMSLIEQEFDLPPLRASWSVEQRSPTVGEVRQSRTNGKPIPRQVMQETIERCLMPGQSLQQFTEQLQTAGMTLLTVEKPNGLALLYQLEIDQQLRTFSASKLGRKYTKKGLQSGYAMRFADSVEAELADVDRAIAEGRLATDTALIPSTPSLPADHQVSLPLAPPDSPLSPEQQVEVTIDIDQHSSVDITTASFTTDEAASLNVNPSLTAVAESEPALEHSVTTSVTLEPSHVPSVHMGAVTEQTVAALEAANASVQDDASTNETKADQVQMMPAAHARAATEPLARQHHAAFEAMASVHNETEGLASQNHLEMMAAAEPLPVAVETQATETLTPANTLPDTMTAALARVQNFIQTLEAKAFWIGLRNQSAHEQWDLIATQAQEQGLTTEQQVEYYVTASACQQGYGNEAIVNLLQQSPRIQAALKVHEPQAVIKALRQSVMQLRQEVVRREAVRQPPTRPQSAKVQKGQSDR